MDVYDRYRAWRSARLEDPELEKELIEIEGNDKEIYERFYRDLTFGTAGLRGVIGAGPNRMNIYTVRRATQGLCSYLKSVGGDSVAIAYDSRKKSKLFAETAARVIAANGLTAHLYPNLTPTPMLSWAVRELHCSAGIVVTASHNPAQYNGYKVYGPDGCQMTTEGTKAVFNEIERCDELDGAAVMPLSDALSQGLVKYITDEVAERFYDRVLKCAIHPELIAQSGITIAFTPLNGTGNYPVTRVLSKAGLPDSRLFVVSSQRLPDRDFTTCPYPNPETPEAMAAGIELMQRVSADILLGTDPDADRVGVAVRHEGGVRQLTGNEVGVLLCDYICRGLNETGRSPKNPIMLKSIVSTELARRVAEWHSVEMQDVLTGFKYIGERIKKLEDEGEEERFIFGFEESCGYLPGSYVRDKDAIAACLLITEMAAYHRTKGRTLVAALNEIMERHGYYYNEVQSFTFEGATGMERMNGIMDNLFKNPPTHLGDLPVREWRDYRAGVSVIGEETRPIALPSSDVAALVLANRSTVIIRPSGTEPKLKVYYMTVGENEQRARALCKELAPMVSKLLGI